MTKTDTALTKTALPEFRTSPSMQSAAASVAAAFHAYQESCFDLPNARSSGTIPANLQAQKDRKQAYHLALKFLATAALKENPEYKIDNYTSLDNQARKELQVLLDEYLDKMLNELIREHVAKNEKIQNHVEYHPVIHGPF